MLLNTELTYSCILIVYFGEHCERGDKEEAGQSCGNKDMPNIFDHILKYVVFYFLLNEMRIAAQCVEYVWMERQDASNWVKICFTEKV